MGDTRSSPHPSMVALECLDGRDERGDRVTTKPLVNNSESTHKGQVLLSGVKEGCVFSGTYRVKQVGARYAGNGAGVPPYGTQH
jgi:hypothetical protein